MIMKELKCFGLFIFEMLQWGLIGLIELIINLCTIIASIIWFIYVLNVISIAVTELFNYYVPSHVKTCYLIFNIEYCINNN